MATPSVRIENDGSILAFVDSQHCRACGADVVAIIAEELRAPADRIRVEVLEVDRMEGAECAPGTQNVRAEAVAMRLRLLEQASLLFGVDASELLLNDGRVMALDGRTMSYQALGCGGRRAQLQHSAPNFRLAWRQ
jgi:hypothetical protein